MNKKRIIGLEFIIDRLTNSIYNVISGDSFSTEVSIVSKADFKYITKKNGLTFNWKSEYENNVKEVYKVTISNNPNIIQGKISLKMEADHVYMNLVESAPFNIGKIKLYEGVAGNLVAYPCKVSFQKGF